MEKRDKSTRILASIDMSNPTMGLSLDAYCLYNLGENNLGLVTSKLFSRDSKGKTINKVERRFERDYKRKVKPIIQVS